MSVKHSKCYKIVTTLLEKKNWSAFTGENKTFKSFDLDEIVACAVTDKLLRVQIKF